MRRNGGEDAPISRYQIMGTIAPYRVAYWDVGLVSSQFFGMCTEYVFYRTKKVFILGFLVVTEHLFVRAYGLVDFKYACAYDLLCLLRSIAT